MNYNFEDYKDIFEDDGWIFEDDDSIVTMEYTTGQGDTITFSNEKDNFVESFIEYACDFGEAEKDDYVQMWFDAKANGVSGVPSARDLVFDIEAYQKDIQNTVQHIYDRLHEKAITQSNEEYGTVKDFVENNKVAILRETKICSYEDLIDYAKEQLDYAKENLDEDELERAVIVIEGMKEKYAEYYNFDSGRGAYLKPEPIESVQDIFDLYPDLQLDIDLANEGECR